MDLKCTDISKLCNTQCYVRLEQMDEKLMQQYLERYGLKMRSPINLHRQISNKNESGLKETSDIRKHKKQLKESKNGRDEVKHVKKIRVGEESWCRNEYSVRSVNPKSKNNSSESEVEAHLKLSPNKDCTTNNSKTNPHNKIFNNGWERSFKGSNENVRKKKFLKVSWSLFGGSQDRKSSATGEEDVEDVEECGRKRSKQRESGEYFQTCKKSEGTVGGGCSVVKSTANGENDACSDMLKGDKKSVCVPEVTQSGNNPPKENDVVGDFPAKREDVVEDDWDSRGGDSEDDKETVVFDGNECGNELLSDLKENQNASVQYDREHNASDVMIVQRKKRKLVRVKRKRKMIPSLVKMRIKKTIKQKNKKDAESSEKTSPNEFLMEDVLGEVSDLVKRLHDDYRVIFQLVNVMPRNGDLADHFKTVILAQKENFREEMWKNHRAIMRGYYKMMSVSKDPRKVALEISKRTLLNVEDVHNVISRCLLVEDKIKNMKENDWKSTPPASGQATVSVQPSKLSVEGLKTTQILEKAKEPDVLTNHSDKARDSNAAMVNMARQLSGAPRYPYFLFGNPKYHLQPVGMITSDIPGRKFVERQNPRRNNSQPTNSISGGGMDFRIPQATQNSHDVRQEIVYQTHGIGSAVNYLPNTYRQANDLRVVDPRLRNPVLQTQSVERNLRVPYVCNTVPAVNCPVNHERILPNHTPQLDGAQFKIPPSRCVDTRTSTHFVTSSFRHDAPTSQIMAYASPQLRKDLNVTIATKPQSENLRISNVTSLSTSIVRSGSIPVQRGCKSIPNAEPNLTNLSKATIISGPVPVQTGCQSIPNAEPNLTNLSTATVRSGPAPVQTRCQSIPNAEPNLTNLSTATIRSGPVLVQTRCQSIPNAEPNLTNLSTATVRSGPAPVQTRCQSIPNAEPNLTNLSTATIRSGPVLVQTRCQSLPNAEPNLTNLSTATVRSGPAPVQTRCQSIPNAEPNLTNLSTATVRSGPAPVQTRCQSIPNPELNLTSLSTTIVRSGPAPIQTRCRTVPNAEPNLLRVAQSQPVTGSVLVPDKNNTFWRIVPEKPANETRHSSVCCPSKTVPVPFPRLHQLLGNPGDEDRSTTDSGSPVGRGRATEIFDPTIPQKLTMRDQRLQAGAVLRKPGGGEEGKVLDRSSAVENQKARTYVCAEDGCKNPGNQICKGCRSVIYCSYICQLSHWFSKHKEECYKLKELRG